MGLRIHGTVVCKRSILSLFSIFHFTCKSLLAICWTKDASLTINGFPSKKASDSILSPVWCLDAEMWISALQLTSQKHYESSAWQVFSVQAFNSQPWKFSL